LAHPATCAGDDAFSKIGHSGYIVKEFLLSAPFFRHAHCDCRKSPELSKIIKFYSRCSTLVYVS
jgi:hypothetical protein